MSITIDQVQGLSSSLVGLQRAIEDVETALLAEIRSVRTGLELRINENKSRNIDQDRRIDQIWQKLAELDAKNASQDATDAQQWAAIKANRDWIEEVNKRLSGQAIELGEAIGEQGGGGLFSFPDFTKPFADLTSGLGGLILLGVGGAVAITLIQSLGRK